jgi:mono/diheme cytochrome c family protein
MKARPKIPAAILAALLAAVGLGACGTQGIQVPKSSAYYHGAVLFLDHCSGCHTLATVGAEGSATSIKDRVRTNGPNFNFRKEEYAQVLFALRNGGFSGAIMPQNILVGSEAREVAEFLAKYSGLQAPKVPVIENPSLPGSATASSTSAAPAASSASGTAPTSASASTAAPAQARTGAGAKASAKHDAAK